MRTLFNLVRNLVYVVTSHYRTACWISPNVASKLTYMKIETDCLFSGAFSSPAIRRAAADVIDKAGVENYIEIVAKGLNHIFWKRPQNTRTSRTAPDVNLYIVSLQSRDCASCAASELSSSSFDGSNFRPVESRPEASNIFWSSVTTVITGWFASRACRNHAKWYCELLNYCATFIVHT